MTKSIDLYTKIVLTIIAACLVCIMTKDMNIVPEAHAQLNGTTGSRGYSADAEAKRAAALQAYKSEWLAQQSRDAAAAQPINVNIVSIAGNPILTRTDILGKGIVLSALPVEIRDCTKDLPVKIKDIESSIRDPLPVKQQ